LARFVHHHPEQARLSVAGRLGLIAHNAAVFRHNLARCRQHHLHFRESDVAPGQFLPRVGLIKTGRFIDSSPSIVSVG
jgi:hypothetical protein